jgi:hypothetical protein
VDAGAWGAPALARSSPYRVSVAKTLRARRR